MSSFTSPLVVMPQLDGRKWRLFRRFTYHIGTKYSNQKITVPAGFVTDFASIPKFLFWLLPWWAKFNKAPVLHDFIYQRHALVSNNGVWPITRKEADVVFLEAMLVEWRKRRSRYFLARLEYLTVRIFGWWAWHTK